MICPTGLLGCRLSLQARTAPDWLGNVDLQAVATVRALPLALALRSVRSQVRASAVPTRRVRRGVANGPARGISRSASGPMPGDLFLPLRELAHYSGLSVRKLRDYLNDAERPLPHYRVGGKIVVRRSEFDAWMEKYRRTHSADVAGIVNDVLQSLRGS